MDEARTDLPDWRDPEAYRPLLGAERPMFAWEWCRRDRSYRQAALGNLANGDPADFGLVTFELPELGVPVARPLWTRPAHPFVLLAREQRAAAPPDRVDLGPLRPLCTIVRSRAGEHLLICDGLRSIRIDAAPGTFASDPVGLRYDLQGLASAEAPLITLRRLLALCRTGRMPASLFAPEARARRWIALLRAHDALSSGASQREIAAVLLSALVVDPAWRIREPSLRSRVQRLVRLARSWAGGDWRMLLK